MSWSDSLNVLIVKIYRQSMELPLNEFRLYVFEQAKGVIHFDSGIWVTRSQLRQPINELDTFLYSQPEAMIQNYARVLHKCGLIDPLFEKGTLLHGKTQYSDAQDLKNNSKLNPIYEEHCKRFNIEHGLSTHIRASQREVIHVVSFYRAERSNPFNEQERQYIEWLMPHFVESFRLNLLQHFRRFATGTGFSAICDCFGTIIEAEDGFLRRLGLSSDSDSGVNRIKLDFEQLPTDGFVTINHNTQLKVSNSGGLFYLELQHARALSELTHRQQQLVDELVKGLPDKIIADNLNISLKTVRNQLSTIYKKLNVNGRTATIAYQLSLPN
jgi:DNA-binding CsgD family transcriptional regulator